MCVNVTGDAQTVQNAAMGHHSINMPGNVTGTQKVCLEKTTKKWQQSNRTDSVSLCEYNMRKNSSFLFLSASVRRRSPCPDSGWWCANQFFSYLAVSNTDTRFGTVIYFWSTDSPLTHIVAGCSVIASVLREESIDSSLPGWGGGAVGLWVCCGAGVRLTGSFLSRWSEKIA